MRSIVAETVQRTEEHRRGRINTGLGDGTLLLLGGIGIGLGPQGWV